jgi:hypothetical protein
MWHGFVVTLEPTVLVWAREARVDIKREVLITLQAIEGALHSTPVAIHVQAGSVVTIPDVGIGGQTDTSTGEVYVTMDQRSPLGAEELLRTWLPLALAHELHHSKRILQGPGYGRNVMQAIISEGTAEAFVRAMYPHAPPIPWVQPLTPAELAVVWPRARHDFTSPDDPDIHKTWLVGGTSGLPRWPGYRLGYAIARAYLHNHPRETAAGTASIPAGQILLQSGFDPSLTH